MKEAKKIGSPKLLTISNLNRVNKATIEEQKVAKRTVRERLLKAWDIHTKNIAYGVEEETLEEHANCLKWYQAMKDLEDWAFEKYLKV